MISDTTYFPTIGNAKTAPQTGFADWIQDFPNPADFYLLLDANSIQPVNNENFGNVNDPFIQQQLAKLENVPSTQLNSVASQWQALDEYVGQEGVRHGVRLGAGAEVHERPDRLRFGRGAPDIPERLEHLAAQVRARIG